MPEIDPPPLTGLIALTIVYVLTTSNRSINQCFYSRNTQRDGETEETKKSVKNITQKQRFARFGASRLKCVYYY